MDNNDLEPENEFGNTEYKLRLTDPTPERIEKLVTQLKWRIKEGNGEAIIYLGVRDDGTLIGLTPEERRLSIKTLEQMTSKIKAKMNIINEQIVNKRILASPQLYNIEPESLSPSQLNYPNDDQSEAAKLSNDENFHCSKRSTSDINSRRTFLQILVKRKTLDIPDEVRVAVLGPTGSGKSTLLGLISHEENDNGRGSARLNLFRHRHEVKSGQTSSISREIIGFDDHGSPFTYKNCLTAEEIVESSTRIITLIDLAGHPRYLNTTLFGLGSHWPDLILLVINPISQLTNSIIENISLVLGLGKSLAIVINKIDLLPYDKRGTCCRNITSAIEKSFPNLRLFAIENQSDTYSEVSQCKQLNVIPVFVTSCTNGHGLGHLYSFLYHFKPQLNQEDINEAINKPIECQVDETFQVPGIGIVVSGYLLEGVIREGDKVLLGPDDLAHFNEISIMSLQRHKIPCNLVRAGQKCTMAISLTPGLMVRRGMVIKGTDCVNLSACLQFKAKVRFLNSNHKNIGYGSQVSVYVANVKQTCDIESLVTMPDGDHIMDLKFTKRPEFIRVGAKIIIRLSGSKAVGSIISFKNIIC